MRCSLTHAGLGCALASALSLAACAVRPPAKPAAPARAQVDGDDALTLRVDVLTKAARAQGFSPAAPVIQGFLPQGERKTERVVLRAGRCVLLVALASPSVSDLDAALYSAEGEVLVEDEGADARPTLLLCARERDLTAYYSVQAYQGSGAFSIARFERPVRPSDAVMAPFDEESSQLALMTKTLRKRGFDDEAVPLEVALSDGEPLRVPVPAKAGQCYALLAAGLGALEAVSLRLLDGEARELARGVGDPGIAALQYCADEDSDLSLEVTATRGTGTARIGRFHGAQAVVGSGHAEWLGEPEPSALAFEGTPKAREHMVLSLAPGERLVAFEGRALSQGAVFERELAREEPGCERFLLSIGAGLSRATLRIESTLGPTLAEAEVDLAGASVSLCKRTGPARIVVIGRAGFGRFTLGRAVSR